MGKHEATFYVQIEPSISGGNAPYVRSLTARTLTQKRPKNPIGGSVIIGLTVRLPDEAFLPLRPEAVIDIPLDLTLGVPVEVEAVAP